MRDLRAAWEELESTSPVLSGTTYTRLPDPRACGLRLDFVRPARVRGFTVEVRPAAIPSTLRFENTVGYTVEVSSESEDLNRRVIIAVRAASSSFNDIFATVAADVAAELIRAQDQGAAVRALAARLAVWVRFFKRAGEGGLTLEEQRGLFAEVEVMREYLFGTQGIADALSAWGGPLDRPHDFVAPTVALEVKSSLRPAGATVQISSARQLDESSGRPLVLIICHLERVGTGGRSLSDVVAETEFAIARDAPEELGRFHDLMKSAGCDPGEGIRYGEPRYEVRRWSFFGVTDGFPRLREADLPAGIEDVKYALSLGACEPFRLDDRAFLQRLTTP